MDNLARPKESVLLYDHGGHNFTYELASDLASRGPNITYAYTAGVTAPHGRLTPTENLAVTPLGRGRVFERYKIARRVVAEIRLGLEAIVVTHRTRAKHVITCNMPVIIVALLAIYCAAVRRRFTIWFQDSQAGIAAAKVKSSVAVRAISRLEGWGLRRAHRVIAISPAMAAEAKRMGVRSDRIRTLANWAPIRTIPVTDKRNDWSSENGLADTFVFLYSGTLGLKHSPERLLALARWIKDSEYDALMLVISEGDVADQLNSEARQRLLPLQVLPFQPAKVLPQLLGTADVCVVLLEEHASEFSVPSKVWSYMCAERPILGSIPFSNEAARIITEEAGCGLVVVPSAPIEDFIATAERFFQREDLRLELGRRARKFAEDRFGPERTTLAFASAAGLVLHPMVARSDEDPK